MASDSKRRFSTRSASSNDLAHIASWLGKDHNTFELHELKTALASHDYHFQVACCEDDASVDKNSAIGFYLCHMVADECNLLNIEVGRDYRRQGVGKILMDQLKLFAAGHKIFLEVRESNQAAIALYQSCGFSPVGGRSRYYPVFENGTLVGREDALLLQYDALLLAH